MGYRIKKLIGIVLLAVMVAGLVPATGLIGTVKAEGTEADKKEKTISGLGTGTIDNPQKADGPQSPWTGNYVYYGQYPDSSGNNQPVKYRVLTKDTTDFSKAAEEGKEKAHTMLLDCDSVLLDMAFDNGFADNDQSKPHDWAGSEAQKSLNGDGFLTRSNVFTNAEREAIAASTKEVGEAITENFGFSHLNGEKIFLLDAREAVNASYGYYESTNGETVSGRIKGGAKTRWWLRSASTNLAESVDYVNDEGIVSSILVHRDIVGVSPALNINLTSVLFSSVIPSETNANAYKLTVKDKNITVKKVEASRDGNKIIVSPETEGDYDRMSVVMVDGEWDKEAGTWTSQAKLKYYEQLTTFEGKQSFYLPSDYDPSWKTYIVAEKVNGEKETDYAGEPVEIAIEDAAPVCYTVTFVDGQGNTLKTEEVESGKAATAPADPKRTGYTFTGWDKDFSKVAADLTVTAQWKKNAEPAAIFYTVTFVDGQGKTLKTQKVESGKAATAPAAPTRSGYTFAGWDKSFSKVTGNMTVTAQWKKNAEPAAIYYTVTFVDGQGKTLKTQKVESGKAATAPAVPTRSGYTFAGWDKSFSKVTKNMTVTAKWKKNAEPAPVTKISGILLSKMTSRDKNSLVLTWNKVKGAEGYDIFFNKCSKNIPKKVKTIKGNKTFKWIKTGLKKKTPYKAVVKAYVTKNGKKKYVRTSPMVHAYTSGGTKNYTNSKGVTVKKTSVSLKAGKTYKIKASVTKLQKGKKLMPTGHAPKLRYVSSNKKIATVSKSGKITAKSKGTCKVYVIAVNGARKDVKVTIK